MNVQQHVNTNAYVKSADEKQGVALEEKRHENTRAPYATRELLQDLSPTAKKYFKIFRLLEPPKEKRRKLYKLINIVAS